MAWEEQITHKITAYYRRRNYEKRMKNCLKNPLIFDQNVCENYLHLSCFNFCFLLGYHIVPQKLGSLSGPATNAQLEVAQPGTNAEIKKR